MSTKILSTRNLIAALCLSLAGFSQVQAIPSLQLNIIGGEYDTIEQSTITSDVTFTLQAYLIPDAGAPLDDWYYLSIALIPKDLLAGDYGSFLFNGVTTVDVTGDMTFGSPPLADESDPSWSSDDLIKHDVFETYFTEFAFRFDDDFGVYTAMPMNVEDNAGDTPSAGTGMYVIDFVIDATNLTLNLGEGLHFDLYNTSVESVETCTGHGPSKVCTTTPVSPPSTSVDSFAPFSHDASYIVPEPASLLLMGIGLLGIGAIRRRKMEN